MGWFLDNGYTGLKYVKNLGTSIINSVVKINLNLFHIFFVASKHYLKITPEFTKMPQYCKKRKREREKKKKEIRNLSNFLI